MSTSSSNTLGLIDAPRIYHGFWHSYGTSLPQGPVLTVSTTVSTFLASGIALYTAWVLSRVWRILDVLIFKSIHDRSKKSLQESQYSALVVNSNAPLDAFLTAGRLMRRGGPKKTLIKIVLAALFVLLLTAATPALIVLLPTHNEGLIVSTNCGYYPNLSYAEPWAFTRQKITFADASFISADRTETNSSAGRIATKLARLPTPSQSYVRRCPAGVTCHPDYPFTFSSNYNLTSGHFGLNLDMSFYIQILQTCYRPIQAVDMNSDGRYCFRYGTYNTTAEIRDCFLSYVSAQRSSPAYTLRSFSSLTDANPANPWTPNSSLVLGGDTLLLAYFIGGVHSLQPSDDPIFATLPMTSEASYYIPRYIVSTIICDTKYQVCANSGRDCSPSGPRSHTLKWLNTKPGSLWLSINKPFSLLTALPPMRSAATGSGAVAASKTLGGDGLVQSDPSYTTVVRELSRLVQTGMIMMASRPQLAALGYWGLGNESSKTSPQLCDNVVIQTAAAVSIPLTAYVVFLSLTLLVVVISYADLLGAGKLQFWKGYADLWKLYHVGQLHREVAEQLSGKVGLAHVGENWPRLNSGDVGLDVIERGSTKYLVPGARFSVQL